LELNLEVKLNKIQHQNVVLQIVLAPLNSTITFREPFIFCSVCVYTKSFYRVEFHIDILFASTVN